MQSGILEINEELRIPGNLKKKIEKSRRSPPHDLLKRNSMVLNADECLKPQNKEKTNYLEEKQHIVCRKWNR